MQSTLSELFIAEHDVILGAGNLISLHENLWRTEPRRYENLVKKLLDFFAVYADQFHHFKEEEILFPAIRKKNEITGTGMVSELIDHHEEFRQLMKEIREALGKKDFESTQQLLESYISRLKDHIAAENDELFPMADDLFSRPELEIMYHKCLDWDREMGHRKKEELENMIKNLTANETVE